MLTDFDNLDSLTEGMECNKFIFIRNCPKIR